MKKPAEERMTMLPMLREESGALALVIAIHVAVLVWVAFAVHPDKMPKVSVMSVQMLPMAPPVDTPPKPAPPKPQPPRPKTPEPKVTRVKTAEPVKAAPLPEPKPVVEEPKPEPRKPEPQPEPAPVIPAKYDAAYLNNPAPVYPQMSRRLRETGTVGMRVLVGPDGRPQEIQVQKSSGYSRLDEAARTAIRKWTFVPSRRGDEKLAGWVTFPVVFNLNEAE